MIIIIAKDTSLDNIDTYYRRLEQSREVDAPVDILIPKTLDNDYMGLVVALFQFAITWIRYPHAGKLLIDVSEPEREDWDVLFQREHLYPIVALAMNNAGVYDRNGIVNLVPYIKRSLTVIRDYMVKVRPFKGWRLLLTSVDHFPLSDGLLPCFEEPGGYIDNETTVGRNLKPAIDELLSYSKQAWNEYKASESVFIAIIQELMKNTYEWGKTDQHNVPIDPAIRGVLLKFYRRKRPNAIAEFRFHKGLREYFGNQRLRENGIEELYFMEISVYDSGIGFVDKYQEIGAGTSSDVDIIKRCLIKHRTSATGLDKDEKGIGLDRILHLLNNRGFLRIKTNHSCLYRNLISHPYRTSTNEKDMELFDWNTHSSTDYTALSNVAGSTVTIIYPLAINDPA